jgi:hypothetical protein
MSAEIEIDGVLKRAYILDNNWQGRPGKIAFGSIYGDRKGRFHDGKQIHTSDILSGPDANGIIRTRNSVYRLEMLEEKPTVVILPDQEPIDAD